MLTGSVDALKHLLETTTPEGDSPKCWATAVKSSFQYRSTYTLLRKHPHVEASLDPSLDERHAADEPAVSLVVVDNYRQRARITKGDYALVSWVSEQRTKNSDDWVK